MPHFALDLRGRSGPIAILIEYIIREEDMQAFLEAMAERRRIRRRDGARQWDSAARSRHPDAGSSPTIRPTWIEYVRHNQRATQADAVIGDRIRALHSGAEPPKVQRMVVRPTAWMDAGRDTKPPIDH